MTQEEIKDLSTTYFVRWLRSLPFALGIRLGHLLRSNLNTIILQIIVVIQDLQKFPLLD